MTDIQHLIRKKDKQIFFQVQLNWLSKQRGILTASDVKGSIHVATPPAFGGEAGEWSPEHLFLNAVSSCFMATYLVFAKKSGFEISGFECETIGQVELVEGSYRFTTINVYPRIYIKDESLRAMAEIALEKTQKHCLISNSISADILYHCEILVNAHSKIENLRDIL
jgi:organic hydroperoxide reductase OsmC/OhrA